MCEATGAVAWEIQKTGNMIFALYGPFHSEKGRTKPAKTVVVCNECDTIQDVPAL